MFVGRNGVVGGRYKRKAKSGSDSRKQRRSRDFSKIRMGRSYHKGKKVGGITNKKGNGRK